MAARKGHKKAGGRKKGTPNKTTAAVRGTFQQVFQLLQEDDTANLCEWARRNPTDFYRLCCSRLMLTDAAADGPMVLNVITGVPKSENMA